MTADRMEPGARVETAATVLPVDGAEVGGDFHVVEETGSRTVALVGDVEGNGPEAAPYADRLCGQLKECVATAEDPALLLEQLNANVYRDPDFDRFTTACAVVIDRDAWSAAWAFAGHLPPHWLDTGMPIDGATPGMPLGVAPECGAISAERRPLRPGEGMLLFTDGLEDVLGPGRDRFGSVRVTHTLARELQGAPPEDVVRRLSDIACEFGSGSLYDDLCLVAFRVL